MKEAASRRQKIIGPLLPNANDKGTEIGAEIADEHPPGVRQNAQTPGNHQIYSTPFVYIPLHAHQSNL